MNREVYDGSRPISIKRDEKHVGAGPRRHWTFTEGPALALTEDDGTLILLHGFNDTDIVVNF